MKVFVFIYYFKFLARILGIGPRTGVLETLILPLNYIRIFLYCVLMIDKFWLFCQLYGLVITLEC
jgi:hypothetical protein